MLFTQIYPSDGLEAKTRFCVFGSGGLAEKAENVWQCNPKNRSRPQRSTPLTTHGTKSACAGTYNRIFRQGFSFLLNFHNERIRYYRCTKIIRDDRAMRARLQRSANTPKVEPYYVDYKSNP